MHISPRFVVPQILQILSQGRDVGSCVTFPLWTLPQIQLLVLYAYLRARGERGLSRGHKQVGMLMKVKHWATVRLWESWSIPG